MKIMNYEIHLQAITNCFFSARQYDPQLDCRIDFYHGF